MKVKIKNIAHSIIVWDDLTDDAGCAFTVKPGDSVEIIEEPDSTPDIIKDEYGLTKHETHGRNYYREPWNATPYKKVKSSDGRTTGFIVAECLGLEDNSKWK